MKALPPAMSKQGVGLSKFIANPNAITKAMDIPASKQTVDVSATDVTPKPTIKPKVEPQQNLVPDPVAAMGVDPKTGEYLTKEERVRIHKERVEMRKKGLDPDNLPQAGDISKVDKLEDAGVGEDQVKQKVKKDLEDEFEIDPKMKKAFMDALALPAKSAAVAMTDLLEKIPAPSKEASKILNRNISKISNAFKLGAASAEVANDEEDNDNKEEKGGSVIGGLLAKAINFVRGKVGGGGEEGGEDTGGAIVQSPGGALVGDPTEGRRAPYTGTADGIGLGDPKTGERALQPIKKRTSLARKMFNLTPMGMAFNAGNKLFKGVKNIANSKTFKNLKGIAGKAFGMTPVGMMAKFMMKNNPIMKRVFNKEQTTNLTELTDKTIQENRDSADAKTQKDIALAAGTGDVASQKSPPPMQQEGGALAQPSIRKSKYIDLYNTTSQF